MFWAWGRVEAGSDTRAARGVSPGPSRQAPPGHDARTFRHASL